MIIVVVVVAVVVVLVVVVGGGGTFKPKLIYLSVWQQHTSRLQKSIAKAMLEEQRQYNNNAGSNASLPSSFCWE
jgi:hypothetical protein